MSITDRDKSWVRDWFEPYKYANINIIEKAFLKGRQYSYNIARKRLLELKKEGYIKVARDTHTNKNIYMLNDKEVKMPSYHRMLLLEVLAELKYQGYDVKHFDVEKIWEDENKTKIVSDGFTIFTLGERRYNIFIEVQTSNNLHNLEKYDILHDMGCVQEWYFKYNGNSNFFPSRILLVSDRQYGKGIQLKNCQVIQVDEKLNNFSKIVI